MRPPGRPLGRGFFDRDAIDVGPELLGKVLVHKSIDGTVAARIVEVEAYRGRDDPGSHAFRGRTERNASMFGPPGHLYTYFVYGMHWCANVVCGPGSQPHAVLLRAARPLLGVETMWERRPKARREIDLCRGPGNLAAAFGFDRSHDGARLLGAISVRDDHQPPGDIVATPRIGLARGRGDELRLRWYLRGERHVSGPLKARA